MAATAENLGRRWFEEVWNRGRREAIAEMMTPACVIHDGATDSTGPEGFYPFFDRMKGTFSDIHVALEDTIAEDDAACIRWSCTMKHTGGGFGIPPTGRTIHVTGISILRASGGKIIEAWQNWDMLGMMEQIHGQGKTGATYIGAT
jgi:predicted ester cyclase